MPTVSCLKKSISGENIKFPMLTGIYAEELMARRSERRASASRTRSGSADLMAQHSHTLSEIHFEAADRLVVYTDRQFPVAWRMGWGDWEEKIARLGPLAGHCGRATRNGWRHWI